MIRLRNKKKRVYSLLYACGMDRRLYVHILFIFSLKEPRLKITKYCLSYKLII